MTLRLEVRRSDGSILYRSSTALLLGLPVHCYCSLRYLYKLLLYRPMAIVSGAYFVIELIPQPFKALAYLNPLAYAIDSFRGALTGTTLLLDSLEEQMALLAAMILVIGALSFLIFRKMVKRLATGPAALTLPPVALMVRLPLAAKSSSSGWCQVFH